MLNVKRTHHDSTAAHIAPDKVFSSSLIRRSTSSRDSRSSLPSQEQSRKRVSLHPPSNHPYSAIVSDDSHHTKPRAHAPVLIPGPDIGEMDDGIADDWTDQVIMAVDLQTKGNIGCCYYLARDQKLLLMSEISSSGAEVLESCKYLATCLLLRI